MPRRPLTEVLERPSIVELILQRLRQEILSGRYAPGTSLPPERELANRYGVNRTSVKHALMKLESVGLIDIKHGVGSLVVDYAERGGAALLEHLLDTSEEIDHSLLADALEVRASIGGAIAGLAAQRATPAMIARLHGLVDRVAAAGGSAEQVQGLDMELFQLLTEATGNQAFKLIMNSVSSAYLPKALGLVHAFADTDSMLAGMTKIVDAVASNQPDAARAAAESHLTSNSEAMLAGLPAASTEGKQ